MPENMGYPVGGKVPGKSASELPGEGQVMGVDVTWAGAGKGTSPKIQGPVVGPGASEGSTGSASDSNPR